MVGPMVRTVEGRGDGFIVGPALGVKVGVGEGAPVFGLEGRLEGCALGCADGSELGCAVGPFVGRLEGETLG